MENENIIIEESVVAEGEEIIIEEVPTDAIDVVVEEEADTAAEEVEEIVGEIAEEETCEEEACEEEACEEEVESATEKICRKCQEVKTACCDTINRIIYDLKETNYNPYIKQTRITRVEIFRNSTDEEPLDTFETTDVKSYSAKALAVASAAAALLVVASNGIVRKFLK
jgi:hypothetical protein